jgi:predicted NAD/FAD-dependent oxidoreductase
LLQQISPTRANRLLPDPSLVPCNAPVQARLKTQRDLAQNFEEDELTIAYLERLTEVQTIEELWDLHCRTMANYGFDRLLYGFTRFHTANSFGDRQDPVKPR